MVEMGGDNHVFTILAAASGQKAGDVVGGFPVVGPETMVPEVAGTVKPDGIHAVADPCDGPCRSFGSGLAAGAERIGEKFHLGAEPVLGSHRLRILRADDIMSSLGGRMGSPKDQAEK